jgi:phosphoserine aminotransferase
LAGFQDSAIMAVCVQAQTAISFPGAVFSMRCSFPPRLAIRGS